jgi:hypothetical protein
MHRLWHVSGPPQSRTAPLVHRSEYWIAESRHYLAFSLCVLSRVGINCSGKVWSWNNKHDGGRHAVINSSRQCVSTHLPLPKADIILHTPIEEVIHQCYHVDNSCSSLPMHLQLPTAVRRLERNHALCAETSIIRPSTNLTGTPLKQIRPNLLNARQPLC